MEYSTVIFETYRLEEITSAVSALLDELCTATAGDVEE